MRKCCMVLLWPVLSSAATTATVAAAAVSTAPCPSGLVLMETFAYPDETSTSIWTACEDLTDRDGRIVLVPAAAADERDDRHPIV